MMNIVYDDDDEIHNQDDLNQETKFQLKNEFLDLKRFLLGDVID